MGIAARVGGNHTCPLANPGGSPHTGGPILPAPSTPKVFVGGQPAAAVGMKCTCAGPPDTIAQGSQSVFVVGQGAARLGDPTAHGGKIVEGYVSVVIGD